VPLQGASRRELDQAKPAWKILEHGYEGDPGVAKSLLDYLQTAGAACRAAPLERPASLKKWGAEPFATVRSWQSWRGSSAAPPLHALKLDM